MDPESAIHPAAHRCKRQPRSRFRHRTFEPEIASQLSMRLDHALPISHGVFPSLFACPGLARYDAKTERCTGASFIYSPVGRSNRGESDRLNRWPRWKSFARSVRRFRYSRQSARSRTKLRKSCEYKTDPACNDAPSGSNIPERASVPSTTVAISFGSNCGSANTQLTSSFSTASRISAIRTGPGSDASLRTMDPAALMLKRCSKY